jgi:hypothetical protein
MQVESSASRNSWRIDMAFINIPAYCPTCETLFPSGIVLDSCASIGVNNCEAACPNGHTGRIMDGTFDVIEGLLNIRDAGPVSKEVLAKMQALAQDAAEGRIDPKTALDEIAEFLPKDSAAAIKKLGADNPLTAILIILVIISTLINVAGGIATVYRTLNPSAPVPSSIINNNITITNHSAAGHGSNSTITKPINRQQVRRLKQIEAKKEKLARKSHTSAKTKRKP